MKRLSGLASALVVCGLAVVGCGGPEQKDPGKPPMPVTDTTGKPAGAGGDKMGAATADAVKDKVEAAFKAEDKLKDAAVTVDHKDGKVVLKGQVADNAAKKQAGTVAEKAVKDAGSTDKVQNMLTAKSH